MSAKEIMEVQKGIGNTVEDVAVFGNLVEMVISKNGIFARFTYKKIATDYYEFVDCVRLTEVA